jgi:hypothetical protein
MSLIPDAFVSLISKVSPILGSALAGPAGGIVGSLISNALGVDMDKHDEVAKKLEDPGCVAKIKELELQFSDLQNARVEASKDQGYLKLVRPLLAIFAMIAIFADIYAIEYTTNDILEQIIIVMLVVLVWYVRQIYKFYFGSGEEVPSFLLKKK